jgi:hypothetical protein
MERSTVNKNGLIGGKWWRFNRYEIREAGFIRRQLYILPAVGAKLVEYDPWARWQRDRPAVGQSIESPYRAFLDMVSRLRCKTPAIKRFSEIPSNRWDALSEDLTENSRAMIIEWCQEYGLLGLMPHSIYQIVLAPHVEKFPKSEAVAWRKAGHRPPSTIQMQRQYARTSRGWHPFKLPAARTPREPGVLVQRGTYESLRALAHFFPRIARADISEEWKTYHYPLPLTQQFWFEYGEPLSDFLFEAHKLRTAVDAMALKKTPRSVTDRQRLFALEAFLDDLLSPIGFTYGFQSGAGVMPRLYAGSLLAAFAAMAVEDVPKGQIKLCAICGSPFIAGAHPQTLYCSKRCRWRQQRRTYRKEIKERAESKE